LGMGPSIGPARLAEKAMVAFVVSTCVKIQFSDFCFSNMLFFLLHYNYLFLKLIGCCF
jgi:hypothetical protein